MPAFASSAGRLVYQMPFPCGQLWRAATSPTHKPSRLAIDLNVGFHNDDYGRVVVASAAGRLYRRKATWKSYGRYVVINHGRGRITLYAHLSRILVRNGARVKQGDPIGLVGNNKGTFDAHLHYEQRHENRLQRIRFNGRRISYRNNPASVIYRSVNDCRRWARPATKTAKVKTTPQPTPSRAGDVPPRRGRPILPLTLLAGSPLGAAALLFVRRSVR